MDSEERDGPEVQRGPQLLARLAARLLRAPIGLISVARAEGGWDRYSHGLQLAAVAGSADEFETAVVAGPAPLLVVDATADERFASAALTRGGVRSYLGRPVVSGGRVLAILAVAGGEPRQPVAEDLSALAGLAEVAAMELLGGVAREGSELRTMQQLALRLATLLNRTEDIIVAIDDDDRVAFWNHRAEAAYGVARKAAVGKRVETVIALGAEPSIATVVAEARRGGSWAGDLRLPVAVGEPRIVSCSWTLVADPDGPIRWLLHIGQEVTSARARERLLTQQVQLLDLASDAIFIRDLDGIITYLNRGSEMLMGFSSAEAVGRRWNELFRTVAEHSFEEIDAELLAAGHWEGELVHRNRAGGEVHVKSRLVLVNDDSGKPYRVLHRAHDVTDLTRALDGLRQVEERQRALLDHSPLGALYFLDNVTLLHANRKAKEMFGLDSEGFRSAGLESLLAEGEEARGAEITRRRDLGGAIEAELLMRRADGSTFPAEITTAAVPGPGGARAVVTYIRDLTEDKIQEAEQKRSQAELEASEQRFRAIFDGAPLGIARITWDLRVIDANAKFRRMLGVDPQETEVTVESFMGPGTAKRARAWLLKLARGEASSTGATNAARLRDGSESWVRWTAAPIRDPFGEGTQYLVMLEDAAALHLADEKSANNLAEMERINVLKSEFVSLVSHEFRTALTGIQGFSELMRDADLKPAEMREFAGDINKDAQRLNRMITEMLDLDRMEAGRMSFHPEPGDLNDVLEEAIERVRPISPSHSIEADLDRGLPRINFDRDRMVQVISNLLSNAVKYSPAGGAVGVASRRAGSEVVVSVSDHGEGLPAEFLGRVFERYMRYEAGSAKSIVGTGLGLPIANEIVRLHAGRMWVESTVGVGSTFHFALPLPGMEPRRRASDRPLTV